MLIGQVTADKEAVLPIELLGAEGQILRVEAGIDTGFNGFLTLPRTAIQELDLVFIGPARAALGDGNEVSMDLFLAAILWEGESRGVLVLEAEGGTLIGMALLEGHRVVMDVEEGGMVSIESLAKVRGVH
ncbi:MAG TPA: clan AA aspartic protease [Thermoanaerobaculia bacterium]|jgi:clan AA aspartic protease|nr:clan AA aspartic protease [Thermoanaerobaculia bacterium]